MIVSYSDEQPSHTQVTCLFTKTHIERKSIKGQSSVLKTVHKFRQTEHVRDLPRSGQPKSATTKNQPLNILCSVIGNLVTSTLQLSLDNDISQNSVVRIKKKHKPCYWSSENPH